MNMLAEESTGKSLMLASPFVHKQGSSYRAELQALAPDRDGSVISKYFLLKSEDFLAAQQALSSSTDTQTKRLQDNLNLLDYNSVVML